MNSLNFILGAKKILSVNSIYSAKLVYNAGKPCPCIYKSGEAKQAELYIKEQVELLNLPEWITKDTLFKLNVTVVFKKGVLMRDLDNCLKLIQDGIFRALDINDSHVVEIEAQKKVCEELKEEKIFVSLVEVKDKRNLAFNYFIKPEVIYIDNLDLLPDIKTLGKRKLGKTLYKTQNKESANTLAYFLSPDMKLDLNTLGNIREDMIGVITKADKLCDVFFLGNENDWGDKWNDIQEFKSIVSEYNKLYSGIKWNDISGINEIQDYYEKGKTN